MKQCVNCLQWKDEAGFAWRFKALGIRCGTCRDCQKGSGNDGCQKHSSQEFEGANGSVKEYTYDYLSTHPCTVCGESDPELLEFHYKGGRGWIINSMLGGGNTLAAIQSEISKCVVLCRNCHRKIVTGEPCWFKSRK